MRTIPGHQAQALIAGLIALALADAAAQEAETPPQAILVPPQSSVFNQNTMSLPAAPMVSGQDVVRGADGTTCQSAVASGGPYLDVGVLQSQDFYARDSAALYGRVVIPIGRKARRVDCTRLYQLEIERMRMELELLRMGTTLGDSLAFDVAGEAGPVRAVAGVRPGAGEDGLPGTTGADQASPGGGVVVPPRTEGPEPAPHPAAREAAPGDASADEMSVFVQAGAFASAENAAARLADAASHAGRRDGSLRPLTTASGVLFRALFGPMPRGEAERLCRELPFDCFVAEL